MIFILRRMVEFWNVLIYVSCGALLTCFISVYVQIEEWLWNERELLKFV